MTRILKPYSLFLFIAIVIIISLLQGCGSATKGDIKVPRLNPKFSYRDKEPMGASLAYKYINSLFENSVASVTDDPVSSQWMHQYGDHAVYIILAGRVRFSKPDIRSLLAFVDRGNHVFISANSIDHRLVDTLGLYMYSVLQFNSDRTDYQIRKKNTWVSLNENKSGNNRKYWFYYIPFHDYFIPMTDSAGIKVHGYNEHGDPNFISRPYGKGSFIFHASPEAFSNHFLLKPGNHEYLEKVFAWLDPETENIYWDNFYRIHSNREKFSFFEFFSQNPSLFTALLMIMSLLLIFLAFGSKRRQRIVPVRMAPQNSTVSYTETIGRLYLSRKDNKNIARKMITYFFEHIRSHYYISTKQVNTDFAELLAAKTGVGKNRVQDLLFIIDEIEMSDSVSDNRLIDLNNRIQECIKN